MTRLLNAVRSTLRQCYPNTRTISSISRILSSDTPIEEETLPHYNPGHYYPVKIGGVYHDRYKITGKLGYGAYSTSWLCRDLKQRRDEYNVLKVSTSVPDQPTAMDRELNIYKRLSQIESAHPGQSLIRELYGSFGLRGSNGIHTCLVLQPMNMTLHEMMRLNPKPFDLPLLKMTVRRILYALDFLHSEANVVHTGSYLLLFIKYGLRLIFTDLKTDNLMLTLEDRSMLTDFATAEANSPSPRKIMDESRMVYNSRRFRRPNGGRGYGLPVLCDFGEARIGKTHETGPFVQPHIYRAPEVIFEMPWGSKIDIWNLACLIWDLFEGEHLFGDIFDAGGHDPFKHLALMVALIGPPPSEFVRRSQTTEQCFDGHGAWMAQDEAPIPSVSLDNLEKRLAGEEKDVFLDFIKSMLRWLPEERSTAKELLQHPFMQQPTPQTSLQPTASPKS